MKKFLIFLLIALLTAHCSPFTIAADFDDIPDVDGSMWDNFSEQAPAEAKPFVSDSDFDKALESKQRKKKKNKNIPKGQMYRDSNETTFIQETTELPVLTIPLNLYISENSVLPSGHYQVKGEKVNGKPVINFYQAHYTMAQIPAIETDNDFGEKNINFVKLIDAADGKVKIIFGNMDFNAYAVIDTAE
jgi:hypothetical protein